MQNEKSSKKPLDLLCSQRASLVAHRQKLEAAAKTLDDKRATDEQNCVHAYATLISLLNESKLKSIQSVTQIYDGKIKALLQACEQTQSRIDSVESQLKVSDEKVFDIPEPFFTVQLNTDGVHKAIKDLVVVELPNASCIKSDVEFKAIKAERMDQKPLPIAKKESVGEEDSNDSEWVVDLSDSDEETSTCEKRQRLSDVITDDRTKEGVTAAQKWKRDQVRSYINCIKCKKPRCVYAVKNQRGIKEWNAGRARIQYRCGDGRMPQNGILLTSVLVPESEVDCDTEVSSHYYNPKCKFPLVCYACGALCGLGGVSSAELGRYSSYHPTCAPCQRKGWAPRTRNKPQKSVEGNTEKQ